MNNLKILHLAGDSVFIDSAINAFERAAPGENDLYIYGRKPLKFTKSPALRVSLITLLTGAFLKKIRKYDLVVVHALTPNWYKSILLIPKNIVVIWLGWGFDYYDIIYNDQREMLLSLTKNLLNTKLKNNSFFKKTKELLKKKLFIPKKYEVIKRIDYYAPIIPAEYQMVREKFLNDKFPIYLSWSYGNLEDDLIKNFEIARILGSDILLGNSASAENNHLDAFALLVKVNLEDRKIISPLCYGDSKYKDLILTEGEIFFGDNFEPLINFMPINEYLKTIEKCGFVIMNHIRQQALGNILIMLYFGAKIFLRKECPTYIFLKEQGAVVFSIQELEKNLDLLQAHIDSDSVKINQKVVMNNWSRDVCKKKTEAMLTLVRSSF